MKQILDAFYKSGLGMEFFETLINDPSISEKLRRQVWTLMSTEWDGKDQAIGIFADTFAESTDDTSLTKSWQFHVSQLWPSLPNMGLKSELDKL